MEETQSKDKFLVILFILFVLFLIIYITKEAGYYEYKAHNKQVLTNESIKQFEHDVEEGKNVSINDYVVNTHKDYSNTITDIGYNIGKFTEDFMNKGIKKTLKVLSRLFYN